MKSVYSISDGISSLTEPFPSFLFPQLYHRLHPICLLLRPNFKPIKTGKGFDVVSYAMAVSNELLWALDGLVEEE
ncbi:MAG: hypothetical protein IKH08_03850 [Prevotella sp.]|nr:hypothetical protein [Prevotella sp.]